MTTTYYDEYSNPIEDWTSPTGGTALAGFEGGGLGYAGYDSDVAAWNKRMDANSAASSSSKQQPTGGSRSYGSPAAYATSQKMALDINSLPTLSLTTPQFKEWDNRAEQSEVQKAVNPMVRENRRKLDALIASYSGMDATARLRGVKQAMQGLGDDNSKSFSVANQIGGQKYANKLNYDNQQIASDAQIANQMSSSDYAQKMAAIYRNADLGQDADRYRYTDYV